MQQYIGKYGICEEQNTWACVYPEACQTLNSGFNRRRKLSQFCTSLFIYFFLPLIKSKDCQGSNNIHTSCKMYHLYIWMSLSLCSISMEVTHEDTSTVMVEFWAFIFQEMIKKNISLYIYCQVLKLGKYKLGWKTAQYIIYLPKTKTKCPIPHN